MCNVYVVKNVHVRCASVCRKSELDHILYFALHCAGLKCASTNTFTCGGILLRVIMWVLCSAECAFQRKLNKSYFLPAPHVFLSLSFTLLHSSSSSHFYSHFLPCTSMSKMVKYLAQLSPDTSFENVKRAFHFRIFEPQLMSLHSCVTLNHFYMRNSLHFGFLVRRIHLQWMRIVFVRKRFLRGT